MLRITKSTGAYEYFDAPVSSSIEPEATMSPKIRIADYQPAIDKLNCWRSTLAIAGRVEGFKGQIAYVARVHDNGVEKVEVMRTQNTADGYGVDEVFYRDENGETRPGGNWNKCLISEVFPSPPTKAIFTDGHDEETSPVWFWFDDGTADLKPIEVESDCDCDWKAEGLSTRASNLLAKLEIHTVDALLERFPDFVDLMMIKGVGVKTADEIWGHIEAISRRRETAWLNSDNGDSNDSSGGSPPPPTSSPVKIADRARETAGLGILPLPYDSFHLRSFMVPSASRPGLLHHVNFYGSPDVACTCEYFQIRKRCRHIEAVKWNELHQAVPSSESGRSSKEVVAFHAKRTGAISKNGKMESYRINGKQCYWFEKRDILDHSGGCLTVPAWYLERHPALATEVR